MKSLLPFCDIKIKMVNMCGAVNPKLGPNSQENVYILYPHFREGSERYMLMITLVFLLNIFLVVRLLMNQCHSFCHHEHYICYGIITSLSTQTDISFLI